LGPLFVALLVVGIGASLGGPTGYAINPARDLGPRVAHAILPIRGKGSSDWAYSWVPIVGPLIGGAIGALLFLALGGKTGLFPGVT
jgi:glycerol uptake facilitator protein